MALLLLGLTITRTKMTITTRTTPPKFLERNSTRDKEQGVGLREKGQP